MNRPPLLRAKRHSPVRPRPVLAGVCSGVAYHLGWSVGTVRLLAFVSSLMMGGGILLYLWLWATVPREGAPTYPPVNPWELPDAPAATLRQPLPNPTSSTLNPSVPVASTQLFMVGIGILGLSMFLWLAPNILGISWLVLVWALVILGGVALVWFQALRINTSPKWQTTGFVLLGVLLIVFGLVRLMVDLNIVPKLDFGVLLGLAVAAVILVALIPLGIKVVDDLTAAKTSEVREAERAEIAAHLHDSVLQTLTLIRAGADDPVRVRSLALTQERELRAWLYTGQAEPEESVAQALKNQASEVEATYGIAIEVVTVGDAVPSPAELAAVAAAGEAMTNAARHGQPPISVFQEVRPKVLEIFVKDAGDGFDPEAIPEDRHGYRHSILGRVERVGGSVTIRQRAGTEVGIVVPRTTAEGIKR
ncbi:PspC domain-containing protein [Scrofimicrobium sp. R131]|uniref:PspC domain-containing protein n=1 Tax=Scrofimicrobium appendicitidis TaxID=3079930 RepID=A0AAU7V5F2_9ACTO